MVEDWFNFLILQKYLSMKTNVFYYLLTVAILFVSCNDNAASKIKDENLQQAQERDSKIGLGGPVIEFDQTEYDFGEIVEGEVFDGVFKITNKGKTDLVITSASASCGCTVPEFPKDAIKPGESADLKFSFSSAGRVGKQNKSITLRTNTDKVTEVIRVKGTVLPKN